jgi:2-polyprenyl-6-hydroxyphenyl methylase / 3-demethylubiquinone-9 3-methyltransferase
MTSSEERIRYDSPHWAREEDEKKALEDYLRLGDLPFNRTKFQLITSMTGDAAGKKVLDYGGGAGIMAIPYAKAGADVVLVDAEANALRTARYYARREGVEQRIRTIHAESFPPSLKNERFDIILAKDIVEHIEDDEQFLRDLHDCQRRGGILLLSTQNSCSLNYLLEGSYQKYWCRNTAWCGWDQTHLRFYSPASLRRKLVQASYTVERWGSVYIIPYNILSWLFLLRFSIEVPVLRYFDLTLGRLFPLDRLGWNIIVRASGQK